MASPHESFWEFFLSISYKKNVEKKCTNFFFRLNATCCYETLRTCVLIKKIRNREMVNMEHAENNRNNFETFFNKRNLTNNWIGQICRMYHLSIATSKIILLWWNKPEEKDKKKRTPRRRIYYKKKTQWEFVDENEETRSQVNERG